MLIVLPFGQSDVRERYGVKVVIGQGNKAEASAPQLHDFFNDDVGCPLAWLLAVRAPDGAERTMLRTAADGLHRRPHIAIGRQQVPSRRLELVCLDLSAGINSLRGALTAVLQHSSPGDISIACHHSIGTPVLNGFLWLEAAVDASKDDPPPPLPADEPHRVTDSALA